MTEKQQQGRVSTSHRLRWRPLDIAVGAGLGAVSGLIYWLASLLAVYVGIISVLVEILPGNAYNVPMILVEAIVEALCAELAFGIFRYRRWTLGTTLLGGILIALVYNAFLLAFYYQGVSLFSPRGIIGTICELISGVVLAGLVSWFLFRAIGSTGALDRLASGQDVRQV